MGLYDPSNYNIPIDEFKRLQLKRQEQCDSIYNNSRHVNNSCPTVFDGWTCWNQAKPGETQHASCPGFVIGFEPSLMAHKVCNPDGTWFRHPNTNMTWSNYTTCVNINDLEEAKIVEQERDYFEDRQSVTLVYIIGYSISLSALSVSLFLFFYLRSLQCARITIHKHLFVSFISNNIFWLIWYQCVLAEPAVILTNPFWCQLIHLLVQYFLASNYFWMFCEGLYLHTVLVVTFICEETIMIVIYLTGWCLPLVLVLVYMIVRVGFTYSTRRCWIDESDTSYIISLPVWVSLVVNLAFMINIVRVLLTKLRGPADVMSGRDNATFRKAVRATLILIPLLGLHYIVLPFRPPVGHPLDLVYQYLSAFVTSLQGFAVACIFCFCNGEVLTLLRKRFYVMRLLSGRGRSNQYSMDTIPAQTTYTTNAITEV